MAVTALLKSAAATRKKIQAQEDALVAFEWENSAQTYTDFVQYSKFLENRVTSSAGKDQLTYQNKIRSARRVYTSNEIQRQQQAIQEGRGTIQDKKQAVEYLWQQAVDNGDQNLAQNLVSNWNAFDLQEQAQAEAAVNAQERLAAAEERYAAAQERNTEKYAKAQAAGYADIAQGLEDDLAGLTRAFQKGGQLEYNKAAKQFVKDNKETLEELGVKLPEGYSSNVGQLVEGVVEAIGQYYLLASEATQVVDPSVAQNYSAKAQDILNGSKQFETPAGRLAYAQVREFAKSPSRFVESVDKDGRTVLKQSTLSGYRLNEYGQLIPIPTGMTREQLKDEKDLRKKLETLGFGNVRYDEETGVYTAQLTDKTNQWFKAENIGKTQNAEIRLEPTATGFQFLNTSNNRLYNIATDRKGLGGLYEVSPVEGLKHVSGQYGFDQVNNSVSQNTAAILDKRKWVAPMKSEEQKRSDLGAIPAATNTPVIPAFAAPREAPGQSVLNVINRIGSSGKPTMTRRADGGFNFVDSRGNPISALTYAKQTGQSFRNVLSTISSQGDRYASSALRFAGDDGAYNPAQIDLNTAKSWTSLTWGNNVNLQTPQAARVAGVKMPGQISLPAFNRRGF